MGRGVLLPNRLEDLGERRELPQQDLGRSPGRQRIFGIFEVHRTLLVERTVPTNPLFFVKKINSIDDWGSMPPGLSLNTPLIDRLSYSLNPICQITSISTVRQIEQASTVTKSIRTTEKA